MAQTRLSQLTSHLYAGDVKSQTKATSYTITEQPLGTPRQLRIICIGAGASGINLIRTLRLHLTHYELVVYEKNSSVGGTWHENRYPGCKCDIPSHNYQFSWRPNQTWKNFFAPASEIEEYLCRVCEEENLGGPIRTKHKVIHAEWHEEDSQWWVKIENLVTREVFDDRAHFLLDAHGILNSWKWPDIPGLHDFKGELVHSANWPEDFSYTNKTVAVIGNGSSGIQIVPAIEPEVKQLVHFIRSPTWIAPPRVQTLQMSEAGDILSQIELDENEDFTAAQKEKFVKDPAFYKEFVKAVEKQVNGNFPIMMKDGKEAQFTYESLRMYMEDALGNDERLCKALIPTFPVGCRRLTPGTGYLEALRKPSVRVVTKGIKRIVPEGVETVEGELIKLDCIVCATGFDVSFTPQFPIIGREGNLQDRWQAERPRAYMSCAVPGIPNYFVFLGPSAPIGHGSVFTITEHVAKYLTRIICKCQTEGIKSISPNTAAVEEFYEHIDTFMPRTAWAGRCRSWFKNGQENGPVIALHPGSRIHFFHMLEQFRGEDWDYVYENKNGRRNRFAYLGNGFSTKELDPDYDSTWYLNEPDAF